MKKLYYIIYEDFTKDRASNVQISNTTNFLFKLGLDINLVFPYKFDIPEKYNILSKVNFLFDKNFSKFNIFNIFKFSIKLFIFLKNNNDDTLVYFRHIVLLPAIYFIKIFLPKIKVIYEVHREVNDIFGRYCEKKLIKKNIKLVVISQALKDIYLNKYKDLKEGRIKVVHDAVDLEKFDINISKEDAKDKFGILKDKPSIIYIGSLWKVKGVDILFRAAKKLPEYNFYLIGKEHLDFLEIKNKYSVLDNIFIKKAIEHDLVPIVQRAADLLVIPHPKNNLSQSPMKLFEYLASGTPILSSDLENLKEILPSDNLYYRAEDLDDLVIKIKEYFSRQDFYIDKAKQNKDIAKKYSWENRSNLIKNFIIN